ncbi:cell division protein FtsL [Clostridium sp.]|uniref:cell division protein FtsL n=1 Tax=Clostridium sp. TaxID=1506 RepID=UPI003463E58D
MIVNEKYLKGTLAVSPERKDDIEVKEKYRELKKAKKERNKRLKEKQWEVKRSTLLCILVLFICGFSVTYSHGLAFTKQKELSGLQKEARNINTENDNLKVELLKFSNFEYIKSNAESKLSMVSPDRSKVINVDLSEDNFKDESSVKEEKKSIVSFIKDLFF